MGLPGLAYLAGFDAVWLATGLIVGTWLNWRFIAAPLRVRTEQLGDSLTLPDYFERRFDDRSRILRTITALFILVFFTFYASSGFVATGRLFESLFGMHYHDAMFWGSIVMLAYTFFGGFLAVSWSDVLQGTLMFFALVLVAAIGVGLAGGFGELLATLEAREPALLDPFLGSDGQALGRDRHRLAAGVGPRLPGTAAHPRALHGDPLGGGDAHRTARGDGLGDRRAARGSGRRPRGRGADLAAARRARHREGVHPAVHRAPASGARRASACRASSPRS